MTTSTATSSPSTRQAALIAGLGLLLMTVLAGLANVAVLERLVSEGDATRTTSDILESFGGFRLAIIALFLVAALDVVVAWALWVLFDRVHHAVAVLAAWCRGLYAAIFAVAISYLVAAALLLGDSPPYEPVDTRVAGEVLAGIQQFDDLWSLGLGLFGVHLLLIGWLAFTSGFVPRFIGVLVVIAGAGYLIDALGSRLTTTYAIEVATFTFIGEVALMVWLLVFAARSRFQSNDQRLEVVSDATTIRSSRPRSRS
jgi:hypothetical protein